jgi:hypothetical protein
MVDIWLGSGNGISIDFIRAKVFGELVKLAAPRMEAYQSDLYHDAVFLRDYFDEPMTFFYSFDTHGTTLGTESDRIYHLYHLYKITVTNDNDRWILTIEEMK